MMESSNVSSDEILRRTLQRTEIAPSEIEIRFIYNGVSAAKYYFFNVLVQEMFNITEEEAAKYIMRLGIETIRARIMSAYNSVEGLPEELNDDDSLQPYAD